MAYIIQQGHRKGSTHYVQGNYAYLCYRRTETVLSLRCQSHNTCKGNAKIVDQLLIPGKELHTCGKQTADWAKLAVKTELKNRAENTSGPMKSLYNSVMSEAPEEIQSNLTYPRINSSMKSARRRNYPSDPATAQGCAEVILQKYCIK